MSVFAATDPGPGAACAHRRRGPAGGRGSSRSTLSRSTTVRLQCTWGPGAAPATHPALAGSMPQIDFDEATVHVEPVGQRHRISINAKTPGVPIPRREWTTTYPLDLIEEIARVKGPAWLCDEIMRDEDPSYVQRHVEFDILSYAPATWFAGKRVLDFGSGCGASTVVMARMLRGADFVGVELLEEYSRISFRVSDRLCSISCGRRFARAAFCSSTKHRTAGGRSRHIPPAFRFSTICRTRWRWSRRGSFHAASMPGLRGPNFCAGGFAAERTERSWASCERRAAPRFSSSPRRTASATGSISGTGCRRGWATGVQSAWFGRA